MLGMSVGVDEGGVHEVLPFTQNIYTGTMKTGKSVMNSEVRL